MRTFLLVAVVAFGSVGLAADEKPRPAAEDTKMLQGRWKLNSMSQGGSNGAGDGYPAIIKALKAEKGAIRFEKKELIVEAGELTAAVENDLNMPEKQRQVENAVRGQRLVLITPKGGEPLYASYEVTKDGLSIHYPAGACSRSGLVLSFVREAK